ncbi:MAG: hypothetical protein CME26_07065 [Gemmatimonadetes bacterium]|nr:hypothetical protein [Gemmatimonadota bacterium]|tara:strand:- start:650 stop:1135 length:486 start_codon:yes stop_codon:yes gene_type:complete
MKWLILTAVWVFAVDARAQNADVFFHSGAQIYIAGNVEKAVATLREGLRRFPEDERIEELLRKIEERQQGQQQSQQQDQQQSQQQGEQQNESEQDRQNDENPGESESERESEDQAEPQPEEGRLTPEEARRLLDAMRDREEEAQERHKVKVSGPEYKGKVW